MDPTTFAQGIAQYLGPGTSYVKNMSFDDFASPFKQWYNTYYDTQVRPEFERYQLNPYLNNLRATAASTGARRNRSARDIAQTGIEQVNREFANQRQQIYQNQLIPQLYQEYGYNAGQHHLNPTEFNKDFAGPKVDVQKEYQAYLPNSMKY